jgi:hypothetical protein
MRNFSNLILTALATFGLWQIWIPVLFSFLLPTRVAATTTIFDIYVVVLLSLIVLGGWIFFVARLGMTLFSGPTAQPFRVAAVAIVFLLSVWFIWSLHVSLQPAQRLPN